MKHLLKLRIPWQEWAEENTFREAVRKTAGLKPTDSFHFKEVRRAIDARGKNIMMELELELYEGGTGVPSYEKSLPEIFRPAALSGGKKVLVVGAGPAGLFAALRLLARGIKPIIIERGKKVRERRRDLVSITREGEVMPDSNYCFGEGGAGTYSDGKLYTRSHKRGDIRGILEALVYFGATEDILVDAHPHIGTNKLPGVIEAIREHLLLHGAEILYQHRLINMEESLHGIAAITLDLSKGEEKSIEAEALILCTGHSARDIFELLERKGWQTEAKSFALGVRIEHPQEVIDGMQYHCTGDRLRALREVLPAASYSLVSQAGGRGTYSFCMCPGGIIAPCATAAGEVVTNGWSPSKRNNRFANSGMVVEIRPEDWQHLNRNSPSLAALHYQQEVERRAFKAGGGKMKAPAQRLNDFLKKKVSRDLPDCSYHPGIVSADLFSVLPENIAHILREGLQDMVHKRSDYKHEDAVLVATESRTSSPVRIPRDAEWLHHPQVKRLYPCGEGGGYAGGIVSAAMDGVKVAGAV